MFFMREKRNRILKILISCSLRVATRSRQIAKRLAIFFSRQHFAQMTPEQFQAMDSYHLSASDSGSQEPFDFENPPKIPLDEYREALPFLGGYIDSIPREVAIHIDTKGIAWKTPESKHILPVCRALLDLWVYSSTGEDGRRKTCAKIREQMFSTYNVTTRGCLCIMRERASVIAAAGGAEQLSILKERFNVPYKDGHQFVYIFVSYLNSLIFHGFRTRYFSCSVAILQTSYSGKSRLMARLAELLPVAYICCPEKSVIPSYPLQTPIDWDMLLSMSSYDANSDLANSLIFARCISFLNTLALFCASVALACSEMSEKEAIEYRKKFIAHQYTVMFWQTVIKKSLEDADAIYESDLKNVCYEKAYDNLHWYLYEQRTRAAILKRFPHYSTDLSMIVCIDNARALSEFVPKGSKWDLLTHLNHASRYTPTGFVLVILGAIPEIKVMPEDPPPKVGRIGLEQAVFTDMCAVELGHVKDRGVASSLTEAGSLEFICGFGKPIWDAVRLCKGAWRDILSVAVTKLINCSNDKEYKNQNVLTSSAVIAIMGNRIEFGMNPVATSKLDPVRIHMANLSQISMEKKAALLEYNSDPVLSYASQYLLTGMDLWVPCLNGLADSIYSRAVLRGERGILAAQLVVCYAIDNILRESIGKALTTEGAPPRWVSIESFLAFFDPKLVKNIPKGLEGAAINLSHFVKTCAYVPNRTDMINFISRGAGVVLENNPSEASLIIPLVLKTAPCKGPRVTQQSTSFTCQAPSDQGDMSSIVKCKRPLMGEGINAKLESLTAELQKLATDEFMSFTKFGSTDSQIDSCKKDDKGKDAMNTPKYLLDPDNLSYILIKACSNIYKEDWPKSLHQLNPYTAGIDSAKNVQSQRPYIALGLHFTEDKVSPDCKAEILNMDVSDDSTLTHIGKKRSKDKNIDSSQHIMAVRVINPHFGFHTIDPSDQQQSIKDAFDRMVHAEPYRSRAMPGMTPLTYGSNASYE